MILYEYPFNERIRTYLRLEHLFGRLGELMSRSSALDHHFALSSLFEIMDVAARADLKAEVMKDLDKQRQTLNGYRGNPNISEQALEQIIGQLDQCFDGLNAQAGKAGQSLNDNDWLMGIRSRISIPGGTCEFDLPAYYAWQHHSVQERQADLQQWASCLAPLADSVLLLLKLLRDAGSAQKVVAPNGQLQQTLSQTRTYQLLRLAIDPALGLIPEISANRLMVSIRLMRHGEDGRLHAGNQDATFDLTLCA